MRHLRLVLDTFKKPLGPAEIAKVREAYSLAVSALVLNQEHEKLALALIVLDQATVYADATAEEIAISAAALLPQAASTR